MPSEIIDLVLKKIGDSGKSINQIAKESGVQRTTITAWLSGRSMPTLFNAEQVLGSIGYTLTLNEKEKVDA